MKRRNVRRGIRAWVFSGSARIKIWQRDRITGCVIAMNSADVAMCLSGLASADEIAILRDLCALDGLGYAIYNPNDAKEGLPFDAEFGKKLARKRAIDDIVQQIMAKMPQPEKETEEDRAIRVRREAEYAELGRLLAEVQERASRGDFAFANLLLGGQAGAILNDTRRSPLMAWQRMGGTMAVSRGGRPLAEELREFLDAT